MTGIIDESNEKNLTGPVIGDYFNEVIHDPVIFSKRKVIYPKPGHWEINVDLPKGTYLLSFYGSEPDDKKIIYDDGLMINLSLCDSIKHFNVVTYVKNNPRRRLSEWPVMFSSFKKHILINSGLINIKNNKSKERKNFESNVKGSLNRQIRDINELYDFLEKTVSRIDYKDPPKVFQTAQELIENGGQSKSFAYFLKNVLAQNHEFDPLVISGGSLNKLIEDKKYYNHEFKDIDYSIFHFWVEFEHEGDYWVCDPTIWSLHLNGLKPGTYDYEETLDWLKKNSIYKIGEGLMNLIQTYEISLNKISEKPMNLFQVYDAAIRGAYEKENLLLSDLEIV